MMGGYENKAMETKTRRVYLGGDCWWVLRYGVKRNQPDASALIDSCVEHFGPGRLTQLRKGGLMWIRDEC